MSDTHDPGAASQGLAGLTNRTAELTAAANSFGRTMDQAFSASTSGGQKFGDVLTSVSTKLFGLVAQSAGGLFASGFSRLTGGLLGGSVANGNLKPFASGGIIGTPGYFPMTGGTGLAGEAGAEAILPLQRGANGNLGVAAQGGGSTIHVQIATPDAESFRRSESYVTGQIARAVARGQRSL